MDSGRLGRRGCSGRHTLNLGGRVSVPDGAAPHWHSTHVGGTIGASGAIAAALGMAPSVAIASYDWNSDTAEMASRAAATPQAPGSIPISNHSYGDVAGWETGEFVIGQSGYYWFGQWGQLEDKSFGQYTDGASAWDAVCAAAPYYLPFVAAGQ